MKALSVLSGGMDSITALYDAKFNLGYDVPMAVHFQYGSKHNFKELRTVEKLTEELDIELKVINLDFIKENFKSDLLVTGGDIPEGHYADPSMKKTVVPFRNGIMLSIAAGLAESFNLDAVLIGNHFGDHAIYPDCRNEFVTPMRQAIELGTYKKIKLLSPYATITKTDIARIGSALGVPFEKTWSCYKGGEKHCGKCGTCVERIEAFKDAGVLDPTEYEQ